MRFRFQTNEVAPPLYVLDGDLNDDLPILIAEVSDDQVELGRYHYDDGMWVREAGSDRDGRDVVMTRDGATRLVTALADVPNESRSEVLVALAQLSPRDRAVLRARCGVGDAPRSLRDIALDMELAVERVRTIEATALAKIRGLSAEARHHWLRVLTETSDETG